MVSLVRSIISLASDFGLPANFEDWDICKRNDDKGRLSALKCLILCKICCRVNKSIRFKIDNISMWFNSVMFLVAIHWLTCHLIGYNIIVILDPCNVSVVVFCLRIVYIYSSVTWALIVQAVSWLTWLVTCSISSCYLNNANFHQFKIHILQIRKMNMHKKSSSITDYQR